MKYYPAFLDLEHKTAVVIGGGKVSERKARSLIKAGASVKLVSPVITPNLEKLKERGLVTHIRRKYRKGDLGDAFIVIAGTSSSEINARVARDAQHLVNVVSLPSEGNYIVPSHLKKGPLSIAISTEGVSPAVSRAVRQEIDRYFGAEFSDYLRFIERIRKRALKEITDNKKREKFFKSLASDEAFHTLRSRGFIVLSKKVLLELKRAEI